MKRSDQELLHRDATRRLRQVLGREPTSKEISDLRHGEQALKLDTVASAKARQLVGQSKALLELKNQLLGDLRKQRKNAMRLARAGKVHRRT